MSSNNIYYIYAYLRNKDSKTAKAGTPYYIGKGKGKRAWSKQHRIQFTPSQVVILESGLSELGAFALERRMIKWWGRKDLNTGILLNQTDGGEGRSGFSHKVSNEARAAMSAAKKGIKLGPFSEKHKENMKISRNRNSWCRCSFW